MSRWSLLAVWGIVLSLPTAAAAQAGASVGLDGFAELLKLPKDHLPPITFARPMVRVSPAGDRLIYIRMLGDKAKLHLRRVGSARSDSPVVWDEPIPALYCRMSFPGLAWRADGQRVLFAQEPSKDKEGWAAGVYGRRMRPWHMCYDLPNPQCKLCRHRSLSGATGCTGLSYSPDGKTLWTAFSDPEAFKVCGVTGNAPDGTGRQFYRGSDAAIYHLSPSPDGKHLAWIETHSRKHPRLYRGPDLVVLNIKARKVVHRIALSSDIPSWLDAQPPVWSADSTAICYGDVANVNRVYRREVRLLPLGADSAKLLVRDALAVGAAAEGVILNRGPACTPMRQEISSFAPLDGAADLPRENRVILHGLSADDPQVLVGNAFAQQVAGRHVIYAQQSGNDVIVLRAELKRLGKETGGR